MTRRITEITDTLFLRDRALWITRLDILKSVALLIMIIDHLGYYFFPDQILWRAIGRAGLPVWFFLAGYSRPTRLWEPSLILGGSLICLAKVMFFGQALPLNALFSILIVHAQTMVFYHLRDHGCRSRFRSNGFGWGFTA